MYFKIPQHVVKGGRVVKRRMGDLTDLLSTDTTLTTPDINFSVDTSQLPLPTIPTVSGPDAASGATGGGFSLTDSAPEVARGAELDLSQSDFPGGPSRPDPEPDQNVGDGTQPDVGEGAEEEEQHQAGWQRRDDPSQVGR